MSDPIEIIGRFYSAEADYMNAGGAAAGADFSAMAATLAADVVLHQSPDLPWGGEFDGHKGYEDWARQMSAAFYADAMDMQARSIDTGDWLCEGPLRRLLITQGANRMLGFAAFACRDGDGLAAIRVQAERNGVDILPSPSPLFGPTAFAVRDPDGNLIAFGLSDQEQPRSGLRGPIQHLTLATRDPVAIERSTWRSSASSPATTFVTPMGKSWCAGCDRTTSTKRSLVSASRSKGSTITATKPVTGP